MEKIVLERFGPVTHLAAAEIIDDNGRIGAYVAEPEAREKDDPQWDEAAFRAAVEAEVSTWEAREPREKLWIQFDPGRDNATSVAVSLKG